MAKEESDLLKRTQKLTSKLGTRTFRQNTGLAWQGDIVKGAGQVVTLRPSDVLVRRARPIHCGLIKGSSDLLGWHSFTITPEMVGRKVAPICAFEGKTPGQYATPEQKNFIEVIRQAGGIAGIIRTAEEAAELVESWPQNQG